ncbi:MAG: hypothetical protein ACQESR_29730, partial [Planctomycetota bacterium]
MRGHMTTGIIWGIMVAGYVSAASVTPAGADESDGDRNVLKAGMIGLTTSHVPAFTDVVNDPNASGPLA